MKPDYYEDFTCIADRCSFTCCREWKIGVDEDTFVKWKHTLTPVSYTHLIEEIWEEFPAFSQYEVRSALAKCGLTTKHIESQVRVLSGGEQAKVRLCKLMNRTTNILLLDEPTNHLDVDAKDELKRALNEYRGAVLLICHEPDFYQDVVLSLIHI